jgi:hypothetical protein
VYIPNDDLEHYKDYEENRQVSELEAVPFNVKTDIRNLPHP